MDLYEIDIKLPEHLKNKGKYNKNQKQLVMLMMKIIYMKYWKMMI